MTNLNKSAFSLLEILLAAIIFVVSVGGIFETLNAVRTPVASKENALTAAVFGKQVLEALRSNVSQLPASYYTGCSVVETLCPDFALSVGTHAVPLPYTFPGGQVISMPSNLTPFNGGGTGTLKYTVSCADGSGPPDCSTPDIAHRVDLTICIDAASVC